MSTYGWSISFTTTPTIQTLLTRKSLSLRSKSVCLVMFLTCLRGRSAPMIGAHRGARFPYWTGMHRGSWRCPVKFESSSHNTGALHLPQQIMKW